MSSKKNKTKFIPFDPNAIYSNPIKTNEIPPVPQLKAPSLLPPPVPQAQAMPSSLKGNASVFNPPHKYISFIVQIPRAEILSFRMSMGTIDIEALVKTYFPYFLVSLDIEEVKYDLINLLLIYGFLTIILSKLKICKLLIKGGKVLQQWFPKSSNDVDVMIMPFDDAHPLDDSSIKAIGQDIITFIMNVLGFSSLWLTKPLELPINVASIYKIAKKSSKGIIALSDIGVGYNYLSPYVKTLYAEECKRVGGNPTIYYYTLCPESFIKEKIYYILYYHKHPTEQNMDLFITKSLQQLKDLKKADILKRDFAEMVSEVCVELSIPEEEAMPLLVSIHAEGIKRTKGKKKKGKGTTKKVKRTNK
jgi:hypothetical protein